jgi:protein-S-isoprenylcysteine O-methyltransferase Ste14
LKIPGKLKETAGYLFHGFSIAFFVYAVSAFEIPEALQFSSYFGWGLLGFGFLLIVLSIVTLVKYRGRGLIESGIYAVVRHPMYLGAMFIFLSYFFFCPVWFMLCISITNIAVIYWFMVLGERQNIEKFGNAYQRYMNTVPRLNIPAGFIRYLKK